MKVKIIYFSGTGNTKAIASGYAKVLDQMGHEVEAVSIETLNQLGEHDLLIVGGPIYAGNMPHELVQWVRRKVTNSTEPKKAIVFSTSAGLKNANGVNSIAKKLMKKGYEVMDMTCFEMPRNFYIDKYDPTPEAIQKQQFIEAAKRIKDSIQAIDNAKAINVTASVLMIDILADVFSLMAKSMGNNFKIDSSCIQCGVCEKNCPKQNILSSEKEYLNRCILCTRCIHNCPVNAISYKNKKIEPYRVPYEIEF